MNNTQQHDFLIIGGGPAGLQLGYFLKRAGLDYRILEAADVPGAFFKQFPRHGKLISINKLYTGFDDRELNLRWDWNSLLTEGNEHLFRDYSREYFPPASALVDYLSDFAARFDLDIELNAKARRIGRRDGLFVVEDHQGREFQGRVLIVATGCSKPFIPDIPGIENVANYNTMSVDPEDFCNKRVLILGKGNSAFETADNLVGTTSLMHLVSPDPVKMAWKTHYVGHLRAVNNNLLDTYQLKSQNALLDAEVSNIRKDGDRFYVTFGYAHADGEVEEIMYHEILCCTGFQFDNEPFDETCRPQLAICDRFPDQTSAWESTNVPGLYFAGTLMQMRDFKKKQSGFIHGFRYNVEILSRILSERYAGETLAFDEVIGDGVVLADRMIDRVNRNSSLWQQTGFICDAAVAGSDGTIRYYEDLTCDFAHDLWRDAAEDYFLMTMEFGQERIDASPDVFAIERPHKDDIARAANSTGIHPIIRRFNRGKLISTHHVIEDLASEWKESKHYDPLGEYLTRELHSRRVRPMKSVQLDPSVEAQSIEHAG